MTHVQVPAMKTNRTRRIVTTVCLATFGLLAALALSSPANADGVPTLYPVQGVLTGSDGTAVDGPHDVVLRLHGQAEGGTALYQETHADLVVESGSFLAYLGGGTPIGGALTAATFENNQDLWLEVSIDGEVITPRFKYGTVPFAALAGKAENAALLGGQVPSHYRYTPGAGLTLSSPSNVFALADRGVTTEKLADGIAIDARTLSTSEGATLASATVSGALDVNGATTLEGTRASSLNVTGATTLAGTTAGSLNVTGPTTLAGTAASSLNVTGATTLAGTTASTLTTTGKATLASCDVSGALDVNGPTTLAGMTATGLNVNGAATLASATVTGAATMGSATVNGAATMGSATVIGNLDVNGVALVGLRPKDCDNVTSCTCDLPNERLLSGGAIGDLTDATLAVTRFVYAQRATSPTTYGALCANVAGGACARISIICARLGL